MMSVQSFKTSLDKLEKYDRLPEKAKNILNSIVRFILIIII